MRKVNFIVGDCFLAFSARQHVIRWSEFIKLSPDDIQNKRKTIQFILGQGIEFDHVKSLENSNNALYELIKNPYVLEKDLALTHKHKIENCHISVPKKLSDDKYVMDIFVDPQCAELNDHITGEHINGMVVVEAARQAFIAVTESYFAGGEDFYFVLSKMDSVFTQFLFPLPIRIHHHVLWHERHSRKGTEQIDFKVETKFFQIQEKPACIVSGEFSLYQKKMMLGIEKKKAAEAIEHCDVKLI